MAVDSLVDSVSTYRRRPVTTFGYVAPFVVLYASWFYYWSAVLGIDDTWELGCIVTAGIGILQASLSPQLGNRSKTSFYRR